MTYAISQAGLQLIKEQEGFSAEPRPLSENVWLVGHSHIRVGAPGAPVSEPEAEALLAVDIGPAERAVNQAVTAPLTQAQYDALVSFAFSIGVDAFERSQVLRRMNAGDSLAAACAMDAWRKGEIDGEVHIVPALVRRRAAEKAMFLSSCAPVSSMVTPPQLDYAASVLGAPQKPGPAANAVPLRTVALAPAVEEATKIATDSETVDFGARITEILRSEPATEVLLLTQPAPEEACAEEEDEITTAHAKPVARTIAEVREATRRAHAETQTENSWWSQLKAKLTRAPSTRYDSVKPDRRIREMRQRNSNQAGLPLSFEHGGLAALLIFGLGLVVLAGSLVFGDDVDVIQIVAATAIGVPGLAAVLMAGYGIVRGQPATAAA